MFVFVCVCACLHLSLRLYPYILNLYEAGFILVVGRFYHLTALLRNIFISQMKQSICLFDELTDLAINDVKIIPLHRCS